MHTSTALIIGGGVIGLSTAYQLARKNFGRIILLEKDGVGAGSSSRAGGIITKLLWTETGVRARQISLDLFHQLSDELQGYRFHDVGCLNLFDPDSWPEREALLPLYDRLSTKYEILDAQSIHDRWPELTPSAATIGLHDPLGGYSEPEAYVPALAKRVRELGVEIHESASVTGLTEREGRITGVTTADGPFEADVVICTAHAWTHQLLDGLGLSIPMKAFVHQRYVTTPLSTSHSSGLELPAVNANPQSGYFRPESGNRLLAGAETAQRAEHRVQSLDFRMGSLSVPADVRHNLVSDLTPLVPAIAQATWETEKVGLICFSMDGEPVLGPVAQQPGLYLGCAFHSGGFAYNPVAGLLLAELVTDGKTSIDISEFSPNRFDAAAATEYLAETVAQEDAVRRRH